MSRICVLAKIDTFYERNHEKGDETIIRVIIIELARIWKALTVDVENISKASDFQKDFI